MVPQSFIEHGQISQRNQIFLFASQKYHAKKSIFAE